MVCLNDETLQVEAVFMLSACVAPSIAEDWFLGYVYTMRDSGRCPQPSQRELECGHGTHVDIGILGSGITPQFK